MRVYNLAMIQYCWLCRWPNGFGTDSESRYFMRLFKDHSLKDREQAKLERAIVFNNSQSI